MDVRVEPDADAAAVTAAALIGRRLREAVRRRGVASVAFSGGATPIPMLADLAAQDLPWASITALQVDERVAPDGHVDRNIGLLDVLPLRPRQVLAMPVTAARLDDAARRYARLLPDSIDVVHLGIGDDGHTASWPPGDDVVESDLLVDVCGTFNGRVRMTLTPRSVNAARARIALVVGASKAPAVRGWLDRDSNLPVVHVRRTGTIVVLDRAAAGG
ncbi:MAG: 6-phosphogluconolactonase [Ilumatobacteraceae bacterium]